MSRQDVETFAYMAQENGANHSILITDATREGSRHKCGARGKAKHAEVVFNNSENGIPST